jgi:hypothetical protein
MSRVLLTFAKIKLIKKVFPVPPGASKKYIRPSLLLTLVII